MTPPAATAAARAYATPGRSRPRPVKRSAPPRAPRGERRISGPSSGLGSLRAQAAVQRPAFAGAGALAPPMGLRIARRAASVQDARLLDRLVRGRAWIALVAVMLIGLVFVQVSLLKLNAGIGRNVATAQTLQQSNLELRSTIAKIDSGQRIVDSATAQGMIMPGPADITYLRAITPRGR
jgi:hypothetical protein